MYCLSWFGTVSATKNSGSPRGGGGRGYKPESKVGRNSTGGGERRVESATLMMV